MKLATVVWLTLVWVLLWGSWNLGDVVNGVLVALLVLVVLPLPGVPRTANLRPRALPAFVAKFVSDIVVSSLQVAWAALRPGPQPANALVSVKLESRSELILTVTSQTLSLVPGAIIVELDADNGMLYAHVLGADSEDKVEAFRYSVLTLEQRVLRLLEEVPA